MNELNRNKLINNNIADVGRVLGLDFLRIALALLIFVFHSQIHFDCHYWWFDDFVQMGAIAMTAFFMLSGYSLHLSSSHKNLTKAKEIKCFYIKRLISILPLYYAVALIRVVMDLILGRSPITEVAILFPVELFATQSTFTTLFPYSHNGGTWFISCLIICYLAYPFLQSLFLQLSTKSKVFVLVILSGILLYAPLIQHYFDLEPVSVYTSPFYRLIEFTIGLIIGQVNTSDIDTKPLTVIRKPYSLIVSIIVLLLGVTFGRKMGLPVDYMLFNIVALPCFVVIIISFGNMKFESLKDTRLLLYLSRISFAFFLCQALHLWRICRHLYNWLIGVDSNLIRISLSFSICLIGTIALHHFIEIPASTFFKKNFLNNYNIIK